MQLCLTQITRIFHFRNRNGNNRLALNLKFGCLVCCIYLKYLTIPVALIQVAGYDLLLTAGTFGFEAIKHKIFVIFLFAWSYDVFLTISVDDRSYCLISNTITYCILDALTLKDSMERLRNLTLTIVHNISLTQQRRSPLNQSTILRPTQRREEWKSREKATVLPISAFFLFWFFMWDDGTSQRISLGFPI